MPGGAAAVVPRMPLRAVGAVAAAVLRIPGKGTKIFFAGKIRSRFSAGAVARTRPFPPGMPESCRSWVASGRPIARRGPGSGHSRPACLSPAASGSHPAVQSPDAAPAPAPAPAPVTRPTPDAQRPTPDARRLTPGSGSGPTPDTAPCNAAPLCSAFPLCFAAHPGAAAHARGRCGRMLFFAVCGRKRFILGEFGNFVTFAPNFKPKQQWHINYSKVRKA